MSDIRIVNLSGYTTPVVKEQRGEDWIAYGEDNMYFDYLIDRYNGSATNNAIINGMSELIYGKGIDASDSNKRPEQYAQMKSLFQAKTMRRVCSDFKMMGQAAFQVIYSKDHSRITEVHHIPIESLRAERCNEEGDVEGYYYAKNWHDVKMKKETPMRIPAFGFSKDGIEILYIRPYRAGYHYYSPVDYQGALPFASVEEEIANYYINVVQNNFSPSMLINFNNGVPDENARYEIEQRIAQKFAGTSNAGRFILAFNDSKEMAADVTPVSLSDAADQYQFLSDEASKKLMVGHRVTSPMLLGIKDQTGLGNNAEELKTASELFENTVIAPMQETILDACDEILAYNEIALNLYFITLQPLSFKENVVVDQETREQETGVKLSSVDLKKPCQSGYEQYGMKIKNGKKVPNCIPINNSEDVKLKEIDGQKVYNTKEEAEAAASAKGCQGYHEHEEDGIIFYMPCYSHDDIKALDDDEYGKIYESLSELGEDIDLNEWELIEESAVDYEHEAAIDKMYSFASTGTARPNAKSVQDGITPDGRPYKVRYQYTGGLQENTRDFCRMMVNAKKIYRKEDIVSMNSVQLNYGWAEKGKQSEGYSIWFYKGGGACHHFWMRQVYMGKEGAKNVDAKSPKAEVGVNKAKREGAKIVTNDPKVAKRPIDMPNEGFVNPR